MWAHEILGVPKRLDLSVHLLRAARNEPALHALKPYYRDHFFHALEVCFLGHFILETTMKNGRRFWEIVADYLGCSGKENNVLRMWYLAALLHDIGYGVDLMKSIRHLLGFFSNAEPISQFLHSLESAFDSISDSMAREGFLGAVGADKVGEDHGMISARHLWALLEKIGKDDCSLDVGQYGPAIRAIGLHNSRVAGQGKNVAFRNDPIAFLLILCDTIQEWNRPRLGFETAPFQMLSWMQDAARDSTAEAPTSKLWLNATYRDDGHWKLCSDARDELTLRLEFTDRINKNDAVFFLWLDATSNLQRLDCTGLDIDINIEFITPFLTKPFSLGPQRQFYRLKDATRETHMGFLNRWFPSKPTGKQGEVTNGAVTYRTSRAPETNKQFEHVTLNLRNLTQSPLITKPMAEFLSCLRRWKNFHDNMEFLGDYGLPEYPS